MVDSPGRCLVADYRQMVAPSDNTGIRWWIEAALKTLVWPRLRAVSFFRLSQWLSSRRLMPVAYWAQSRAIRGSGMEISPLAKIGPGMVVMHSNGIVIGPQVRVGSLLIIYQGVTLGDGSRPGQPLLGDRVLLGAGCSVLGGVSIGDDAVVGAGSVVTQDVPAGMVAVGSPAVIRAKGHHPTENGK